MVFFWANAVIVKNNDKNSDNNKNRFIPKNYFV